MSEAAGGAGSEGSADESSESKPKARRGGTHSFTLSGPGALQFLQNLQAQPGRPISRLSGSALVDLDYEQDIRLRKVYAMGVLVGLGVQLAIADTLVFLYAALGVHWKVHTSVLQVWLGATVIEVLGVVLVVTRNLFPRRDASDRSSRSE